MQRRDPKPTTILRLLTSLILLPLTAPAQTSPDFASPGTIAFSSTQGHFDFEIEALEESLCHRPILDPFEVVTRAFPPDYTTAVIRTGGGGDGKVYLHHDVGIGTLTQDGIQTPVSASGFCVGSTSEIQLSCGRFSFETELDPAQPSGTLLFEGTTDLATTGDFEADLPLVLRFTFHHLDDGWQAEAYGQIELRLSGSWASQGLDGSPAAGSPIDIDEDCDGVVDRVEVASSIYLGVAIDEEGTPGADLVCGHDSDHCAAFCFLP